MSSTTPEEFDDTVSGWSRCFSDDEDSGFAAQGRRRFDSKYELIDGDIDAEPEGRVGLSRFKRFWGCRGAASMWFSERRGAGCFPGSARMISLRAASPSSFARDQGR